MYTINFRGPFFLNRAAVLIDRANNTHNLTTSTAAIVLCVEKINEITATARIGIAPRKINNLSRCFNQSHTQPSIQAITVALARSNTNGDMDVDWSIGRKINQILEISRHRAITNPGNLHSLRQIINTNQIINKKRDRSFTALLLF
jgi:hypothetical protein